MKRKINYHEHDRNDIEAMGVASASECTGLMQTPPHNEAELESYKELSSMETTKEQ